jgi:hypothetical protein
MKRRVIVAALAMSIAGGSAFLFGQAASPIAPPPPGPATMPEADKPIAVINGREINNAAFYNLMMQIAGMRVFQQVFDLTLVQRACMDAGIPLDGPDFEKRMKDELQRTLDEMSASSPQLKDLKDDDKLRVLNQLLAQRGVTVPEFQMGLQRAAGLRALAKGKVDVTDKEIEEYYTSKYGDRVLVRVFNVGSVDNAAKLREQLEKQKKPIEDAARDAGLQLPNPQLIPKNASNIDQVKSVAFALNEHELSAPVSYNGGLLMIYLEKKQPSETAKTSLASVKSDLQKEIYNIKETQWMTGHLNQLRANAAVTINNPVLQQQFAAIADQMKRQAEATSQPATMPGALPAATAPAALPGK